MTTTQRVPPIHLIKFFAPYEPGFVYEPSRPIMAEFQRLCTVNGWSSRKEHKKAARKRLNEALVNQFNASFGTDVNNLSHWQVLCRILGIQPPDTITSCRKTAKAVHVNIVDLVNAFVRGGPVKRFPSQRALSRYSLEEGKLFSKQLAKESGLLKYLLREIM